MLFRSGADPRLKVPVAAGRARRHRTVTTPRWSAVFLAFFLVGAALRGIDVWRPVDGSIRNDWREADVAAMARNFYREGMDIRYPRIDWRGRGPGFVESEFPLYPWTVAWLYRAFGLREELARVLSYLFSLAALGVFIALARHLLSPFAAAGATLFYVLSPMEIRLATAIQPEPLMLLAYLTAEIGRAHV